MGKRTENKAQAQRKLASLVYSPLTRDGGARLNRSFTLYGASTARSLADSRCDPCLELRHRPQRNQALRSSNWAAKP